jgi:hypothetical protein
MVALKVRDSKQHSRILQIEGQVLASGIRVAVVMNDQYIPYEVNVHPDGRTSCRQMQSGNPCWGHKSAGHCYHVDAVKSAPLPYEHDNCVVCGHMIKVGTVICGACLS